MITVSHRRNLTRCLLAAVLLLLTSATFGWADPPDPTTPSRSIAEILVPEKEVVQSPQPAVNGGSENAPPVHLRLKGIVLRDSDNGTALISFGRSELYVVALRRTELHSASNLLNIGGMRLAVKDFSESCVILQNLDTDRQFVIH